MIKFSYNHFIIRLKLNKIFPGLLYGKDSFYYLTCRTKAREELRKARGLEESDSVQLGVLECEEKQRLMSKESGSGRFAYLSTTGEY